MGNIRSIYNKIQRTGYEAIVTHDPALIKKADKLILPGVGHFQKAIEKLKKLNLIDILHEAGLIRKTPILGICLGMQLMASHSEEGDTTGLNWFDAGVLKFSVSDKRRYKVPHMGWNNVTTKKDSIIFQGIPEDSMYYFVHSYHIKCNKEEDILTTTEYGYQFTSAIQKNNIFGTQFHPEKSHYAGERMIYNFLKF